MKHIYALIFTLTVVIACSPVSDKRKVIVNLDKNIGTASFEAFLDRDTLLNWIDKSDNFCSFKTKYRIQDPALKPIMESGFVKSEMPNDGFFLTIEHSIDPQCDTAFGELTDYPNRIRERTNYVGRIDSTIKINDTRFYVFDYSEQMTTKEMRIDAVTSHNRWILHFVFSNFTLPRDSFANVVSRTIKSIEIH